jgi:hypothetical protein
LYAKLIFFFAINSFPRYPGNCANPHGEVQEGTVTRLTA